MERKVDHLIMPKHQPREHAVNCPFHSPRHPVQTWNFSGYCDQHEQNHKDDNIFKVVKEAQHDFA
jgi:hypothetical protein